MLSATYQKALAIYRAIKTEVKPEINTFGGRILEVAKADLMTWNAQKTFLPLASVAYADFLHIAYIGAANLACCEGRA